MMQMKRESIVLLTILGLTAFLAGRALPQAPAVLAAVVTFREPVGPWVINGSLTPRSPSGFDLAFGITNRSGGPPAAAIEVIAVLTMLDHRMAPVESRLSSLSPGVYRLTLPLQMAGRWELAIRVPEGAVRVGLLARTADRASWWKAGWRTIGPGLFYVLFGAALGLHATERLGLRTASGRTRALLGVAVAAAGIFLLVRSQAPATPPRRSLVFPSNPVSATSESIQKGEGIYRMHCQACHGAIGAGDGPAAARLDPRPADLRVHMAAGHTDGELFIWITDGMPGTAMPPFETVLSEEDRWNAINFIRTFAPTDR